MIRSEIKTFNMILTEMQKKYQHYNLERLINVNIYLTGEEILTSDQRRVIEQTKCTYSPLEKALEKLRKTIEDQRRKQINAITNENKRLPALTNKDDHKDNYKGVFQKLVRERFDIIKELTDEINHDILTFHFKGNLIAKDLMISIMYRTF